MHLRGFVCPIVPSPPAGVQHEGFNFNRMGLVNQMYCCHLIPIDASKMKMTPATPTRTYESERLVPNNRR